MCFVCQRPDRKIIQHSEAIVGVLAGEEGDKYVSRGEKWQLMDLLPRCHSIIQQKCIKFRSMHIYQVPRMWTGIVLRPVSTEVHKTHHLSLGFMEKSNRRHRCRRGDFSIMW